MTTHTEEFSANSVANFEYPKNIWKRPSMYLGERGSQQSVAVREIIDNAVHECIRGFADTVLITFGDDKSITVKDNGRGLPVDINEKTGKNGIVLTMATLHAGSNFSSNIAAGKAGAGLNGVGASAANALSKRFDVTVYKKGKKHTLSFQNGFAGHFIGDSPDGDFTPGEDIKVEKDTRSAAERKGFENGTTIKLWFNEDRFPRDEKVNIIDLIDRLKYTAYIVPKIHLNVIDETRKNEDGSDYSYEFYSEHGLPEMMELMANDMVLPSTTQPSGNQFEKDGVYFLQGKMDYTELGNDENEKTVELKRTVTADVAFRYGTGYEKNMASFVNTIHTHLGGVHERAFEKALLKTFGERMASMRGVLTSKDEPPIIDDYFEGMTVALSVNVPEPQFIGQQKDKLSGPEVEKALTKAFTNMLSSFVNAADNQKILKPMLEKVVQASRNRHAAAEAKLAKRKSTQLSSAAMPAKLADCDITSHECSELIICEGDSAAGTVIKARNAMFQAVLPIRGKLLNTLTVDNKKILANKEIMDIATAMGAGFGTNFDIEKIRYGRVLFAADADADGLQINNLLFTLFNRLFKDMILEGRVYQTMPPLFEIIVGKGKNAKTIYAVDDAALAQELKKLQKDNIKYEIRRNKGLAAMSAKAFSETVLDPETRSLRRITMEDVEAAEVALHLTMGENSEDRREFMTDNFQTAIDSGLVEGFEEGIE